MDFDLLALQYEGLPAGDTDRVGDLAPEQRARAGVEVVGGNGVGAPQVAVLDDFIAGLDDVRLPVSGCQLALVSVLGAVEGARPTS